MLQTMPPSQFVKPIDALSEICRQGDDPIVLTRQGQDDLVVLGIEAYNKLLTIVWERSDYAKLFSMESET